MISHLRPIDGRRERDGTSRELAPVMPQTPSTNTLSSDFKDLSSDAKHLASDVAGSARSKLDSAREQVGDKLDSAREQVGELASRAADSAGRLSKRARGGAVKVGEAVSEFVQERPIVSLGIAFVAGYAIISMLRRR
jgi:ElaB/YqjD/DUF883 family membrane-anchored ribosome-binding protein